MPKKKKVQRLVAKEKKVQRLVAEEKKTQREFFARGPPQIINGPSLIDIYVSTGIEADLSCSVDISRCTEAWEQLERTPSQLTEQDLIRGLTHSLSTQNIKPQQSEASSIGASAYSGSSSPKQSLAPKFKQKGTTFFRRIFTSSKQSSSKFVVDPEHQKRLEQIFAQSQTKASPLHLKRTIHVWDFGGQVVYYILHYIFLRTHCIYILVVNLAKPLDSLVKVPKNLGKLAEGLQDSDVFMEIKYLDQILTWLNMILTSLKVFGERQSPCVILVGTHKDLLHNDKAEQERLAGEYLNDLTSHFNKVQGDLIIKTPIAVDSKNGDPNFDILRELIIEAMDQQSKHRQYRPVKWLRLEKSLYEYSHANPHYQNKLIPFEKAQEIAKENKMSNVEDMTTFLEYHHLTGDLTYFRDESLQRYFIIDSQWLIDVIRSLITLEVFHDKLPVSAKQQLKQLHNLGILERDGSLIQCLWSPFFKSESGESQLNQEHIDHLLALMAKFDLVVKHGETYIVQCFLPTTTETEISQKMEDWKAIVCPIYFVFHSSKKSYGSDFAIDDLFLPYGLFLKLISRCAKHRMDGSQWVKLDSIFQNAVIYRHENVKILLHVIDSAVRMSVLGNKDSSTGKVDLSLIWSIVSDIMKGLMTDYHPNMWFEMCVQPCRDHPALVGVGITSEGDSKLHHAPCLSCGRTFFLQAFNAWFTSVTLAKLTHSKLWELAKRIPDESYRMSLGFELDIPDHIISKCAVDHPDSIWQASYEMLSHWFNTAQDERKACAQLCEALKQSQMARLAVDIGIQIVDTARA